MHGADTVLLLLVLGAAVALLIQGLRLRQQTLIASRYEAAALREQERHVALHARSERAVAGESDALVLLSDAGYQVLERQVRGSWMVHADGEPHTFDLRADYLVAFRGRRYVAEVKTGRVATRLSHGATRRQLLEYWAAFDVDGVLLVDADQGSITHVELDPLALLSRKAARGGRATAGGGRWTLRLVAAFSLAAFVAGLYVGATGR